MLLNEHEFAGSAPERDAPCLRCGLEYRFADAWRTRCQPKRKPQPEPEAQQLTQYHTVYVPTFP